MNLSARTVTFGLTAKLFLAILAVGIIVILAMGAALRWNFERDFFSYIQAREARRAERIEASLTALYRRDGSWRQVQRNPAHWRHLLSVPPAWPPMADDIEGVPVPAEDGSRRSSSGSAGQKLDLPPVLVHSGIVRSAQSNRPPALANGGNGYDADGLLLDPLRAPPAPPYTLLSSDEAWLAGADNPSASAPRRPIRVGERTVGWLITPMPERIPDDADLRFQSEQREATWSMGLLAVVLAAIASISLARIVLAPVRRLGRGTHALVAGDYTARVRVTSSDELSGLAQDFNALAETLQRNEALRREWFADISHELRTPLAIMRGEVEALQDNIRPVTPQALQSLQAEVARLSKLVDDLYDLALSDVGALTYRMVPVAIDELVRDEVQAFATRMQIKGIEVVTDITAVALIEGDEQRLAQLISNILENALRYTNAPGRIEVRVLQAGRQVVVDIEDSLPGVPADALPRLFDRLFRVDPSRSRVSGGAGLGLAICERIVHSHHGTVKALASSLGGLRVRIALPVAPDTSKKADAL